MNYFYFLFYFSGRLLPLRCGALRESLRSTQLLVCLLSLGIPVMAAYDVGRFVRSHFYPSFGNEPGFILYHSNAPYATLFPSITILAED
jgi:hypothetical protein